jgi:hypothetical protein
MAVSIDKDGLQTFEVIKEEPIKITKKSDIFFNVREKEEEEEE